MQLIDVQSSGNFRPTGVQFHRFFLCKLIQIISNLFNNYWHIVCHTHFTFWAKSYKLFLHILFSFLFNFIWFMCITATCTWLRLTTVNNDDDDDDAHHVFFQCENLDPAH